MDKEQLKSALLELIRENPQEVIDALGPSIDDKTRDILKEIFGPLSWMAKDGPAKGMLGFGKDFGETMMRLHGT